MRKLLIGVVALFFSTSCTVADVPDTDETVLQSIQHSIECMAKNIYFEARGESYIGKIAVAHVTLNRVTAAGYPDSVCGVVYQRNQFSWTSASSKIRDFKLYEQAKQIAHDVLMGQTKDPTRGAVSFHNRFVDPAWNKRPVIRIGNHVFYK